MRAAVHTGKGHEAARKKPDTPRRAIQRAVQAARAIEAAGGLLAGAAERMEAARRYAGRNGDKMKRDEEWVREWGEIMLVLADHADAMQTFLGDFMSAPFFRRIAQAAHERDLAERKEKLLDSFRAEDASRGDGKGGAA